MPKIRVPKADGTPAPVQPGAGAAASASGGVTVARLDILTVSFRQVNVGGRVIRCSGVGSRYCSCNPFLAGYDCWRRDF